MAKKKEEEKEFKMNGAEFKKALDNIVTEKGIDMVIANGENPLLLYDIISGKEVGTRFLGKGK